MKKIVLKESGRNWLRKGVAKFFMLTFGLMAVFVLVMVLSAPGASFDNPGVWKLLLIGLLFLVIPFLPALKSGSEIELISDGDQLVVKRDNVEELKVQWSEIYAIKSMSVVGTVKGVAFSYRANGKKRTYDLKTFYLNLSSI